jgi:spermidine synthase
MIPWKLLDTAQVPGNGGEMRLYERDGEFSIRLAGRPGDLMNSRMHGSEDALAEHACARLASLPSPRVLIGGLGLGFTLAAALQRLPARAEVVVAELVPAVVAWNRAQLAALAGRPLEDPRVQVYEGDVGTLIRKARSAYDAILLDVDNGPEGLTRRGNDALYGMNGLVEAHDALTSKGVLAVWSAGPDGRFVQRLHKVGFDVEELRVRAHGSRGTRHVIWLATKR